MQHNETPRIYVACLSAYNNGNLHGAWVDVDPDLHVDADDLQAEIDEIIASSPMPDAEEWAIHDFENWHGIEISENESLEKLVEIAELIKEHGKAYAVYHAYFNNYATAEDFKELYRGKYESEESFVQEQWDEQGITKELAKLGVNESYINWEAIARDWFIDSYLSLQESHNEVYVFSRN